MKHKIVLALLLISFLFIIGCSITEVRIKPIEGIDCNRLCTSIEDTGGSNIECGVEINDMCKCYSSLRKCFKQSPESYIFAKEDCN